MNSFFVVFAVVLAVANAGLIAPGIIGSGIVAPGLIGARTIATGGLIAAPASTILAGPSGTVIANQGLGLGLGVSNVGIVRSGLAPISTGIVANSGLLAGGIVSSPILARSGLIAGNIW